MSNKLSLHFLIAAMSVAMCSCTRAQMAVPTSDPNLTGPIVQLPVMESPFGATRWSSNVGPGVPKFWVRPGFKVTLIAERIGEVRFITFDTHGTMYVAQPNAGTILALRKSDGVYKPAGEFVTGYKFVHGMQVVGDWLWFTTSDGVHKARIGTDGKAEDTQDILTGLPHGGHWWRSILVDGDGFYTSIGDAGNITDLTASDREKIWRYSLDGKSRELFSSGIRNTEKLLIRPATHDIYGCDQGSDWFGQKLGDHEGYQPVTDYYPPDEFNHYVKGGFYGHPFIVGDRMPRFEYANRPDILQLAERTIAPVYDFGPHWAADGWIFDTKGKFGEDYVGDALVALHGSWNRSTKAGYRIHRIKFDKVQNEPEGGEMLVGTLSETGQVLARPVDVAEAPDGAIYFSADESLDVDGHPRGGAIFLLEKVK
jgi:glucose/arabinose dehydrogenase